MQNRVNVKSMGEGMDYVVYGSFLFKPDGTSGKRHNGTTMYTHGMKLNELYRERINV